MLPSLSHDGLFLFITFKLLIEILLSLPIKYEVERKKVIIVKNIFIIFITILPFFVFKYICCKNK